MKADLREALENGAMPYSLAFMYSALAAGDVLAAAWWASIHRELWG